jgi:outer membrane receptor protein involved in Fe transport
VIIAISTIPAFAKNRGIAVSIVPTTLAAAIPRLAQQCGCDIVSVEPGLRQIAVRPLFGIMSVEVALKNLLAGTGYRAVTIGGGNYRIVRATIRQARAPIVAHSDDVPEEIVVTASKQQITLLRFPGTIFRLGDLPAPGSATGSPNLDTLSHATPVLQNTALGEGRNKTFIRGIADSSFNGAAQSTASTYFGDVQLGYSGPGPALHLYDVQSVEVMEGPQGTLYGGGSIGGIIRITPNPVDLSRTQGSIMAGVSATSGGALGYDLSGMINAPLVNDRFGIRAVAYRQRVGGYIDSPRSRQSNINGMNITGARAELRANLPHGWDVAVGGLTQTINASGAQYGERPAGPLGQFATVPQPFSNRVRLGRLVVNRRWDNDLQLTSATGVVYTRSNDVYDATGLPATFASAVYDERRNDLLLSQETRLSRSQPNGASWLTGFSLVYGRNSQSRALGMVDTPKEIVGVTNVTKTISAFAEATIPVTAPFSVTFGARATRARTDGDPSIDIRETSFVHGRSTFRMDPTLAMSWLLGPKVALYARFQSGFRTGGIAVARGIGRVADFQSDTIGMGEIGFRMQRHAATGIALSAAVSYAHWKDIQADLINRRGQPYTANIGNAEIYALEGTADWVPLVRLHATMSFLYTYNRVYGPIAQTSVQANRRLPDTPPFAANVELGYRWPGVGDSEYRVSATGRYIGRSVLGSGDFLDISQGQYGVVGVAGAWRSGKIGLLLSVDNLTNTRANRFSFGNPFTFFRRDQTTPVQPLTIRAGIAFSL